jgi:hypothetical protein
MLPANLPAINTAKLPGLYETAVVAIAECAKIDECKSWADKMEALASYARQSDDERLMRFAMRIRARAIDRVGEILRSFPDSSGKRTDLEPGAAADTRFGAAHEAGLSKRQAITALRVNNVPRDVFEELVESDSPPTISALAELGTNHQLQGRDPVDFEQATRLIGMFTWLDERCGYLRIDSALRGLGKAEFIKVRAKLLERLDWLEALREAMEEGASDVL